MFQRRSFWSLAAAAVCLMMFASCARAQEEAAAPAVKFDPKAEKVVKAFADYVKNLKAFDLATKSELVSTLPGQNANIEINQTIRVERPNKFAFAISASQPNSGIQVASDGKEMLLFVEPFQKFALEEAPESLGELLENPILIGLTSGGGAGTFTACLFSDDPYEALTRTVQELQYVGLEEKNGKKAHHIKALGEPFDWETWIPEGKQPLPSEFVTDMSRLIERMAKQQGQKLEGAPKFQNVLKVEKWDTAPKFGADAFALVKPEGATEVDSLMEMFGQRQTPDASELLGKAAPAFDLETLEGPKANLASLKDKVVILDFWATWCGPCRAAMPIISEVANEFKDQGVVFYAVNIQEDSETIKKFLTDEKLELPVALDKEGAVAEAYLASAIPQTVLIGKDGTVQVVHVGLSDNLKKTLTSELESLVAGKKLAEAKPEKEEKADEAAE